MMKWWREVSGLTLSGASSASGVSPHVTQPPTGTRGADLLTDSLAGRCIRRSRNRVIPQEQAAEPC